MTDNINERFEESAHNILSAAKEMREKIPLSVVEQEMARLTQLDIMKFSLDRIRTMRIFMKDEVPCFRIIQAAMLGSVAALQGCLDEGEKMTKEGHTI